MKSIAKFSARILLSGLLMLAAIGGFRLLTANENFVTTQRPDVAETWHNTVQAFSIVFDAANTALLIGSIVLLVVAFEDLAKESKQRGISLAGHLIAVPPLGIFFCLAIILALLMIALVGIVALVLWPFILIVALCAILFRAKSQRAPN